jgi:hypothetical protein
MSDLLTIGDLKRITGRPSYTINYAIEQHGPAPVGRIGIARVWNREQLGQILESIQRTSGGAGEATE